MNQMERTLVSVETYEVALAKHYRGNGMWVLEQVTFLPQACSEYSGPLDLLYNMRFN